MTITRITPATHIRRGQYINLVTTKPGRAAGEPCVVAFVNGKHVAFRHAGADVTTPVKYIQRSKVLYACDTLDESRRVHGMAAPEAVPA